MDVMDQELQEVEERIRMAKDQLGYVKRLRSVGKVDRARDWLGHARKTVGLAPPSTNGDRTPETP